MESPNFECSLSMVRSWGGLHGILIFSSYFDFPTTARRFLGLSVQARFHCSNPRDWSRMAAGPVDVIKSTGSLIG